MVEEVELVVEQLVMEYHKILTEKNDEIDAMVV